MSKFGRGTSGKMHSVCVHVPQANVTVKISNVLAEDPAADSDIESDDSTVQPSLDRSHSPRSLAPEVDTDRGELCEPDASRFYASLARMRSMSPTTRPKEPAERHRDYQRVDKRPQSMLSTSSPNRTTPAEETSWSLVKFRNDLYMVPYARFASNPTSSCLNSTMLVRPNISNLDEYVDLNTRRGIRL
jgi:hypothetical protein